MWGEWREDKGRARDGSDEWEGQEKGIGKGGKGKSEEGREREGQEERSGK